MSTNDNLSGSGQPKSSFRWVWIALGLVILAVVAGVIINNTRQQRDAERTAAISQTSTAAAQATSAAVAEAAAAAATQDTSQPFGRISFGWGGFRPLTCVVSRETTTFSALELNNATFIYFVSPFLESEVGNYIKWKIVLPDGTIAYDAESRIYNDEDLCFWQGFVLADEDPGEHTLEITDWNGNVTTINFIVE